MSQAAINVHFKYTRDAIYIHFKYTRDAIYGCFKTTLAAIYIVYDCNLFFFFFLGTQFIDSAIIRGGQKGTELCDRLENTLEVK